MSIARVIIASAERIITCDAFELHLTPTYEIHGNQEVSVQIIHHVGNYVERTTMPVIEIAQIPAFKLMVYAHLLRYILQREVQTGVTQKVEKVDDQARAEKIARLDQIIDEALAKKDKVSFYAAVKRKKAVESGEDVG